MSIKGIVVNELQNEKQTIPKLFLTNQNFTAVQKLGEGSFGCVYKVKDPSTNEYFAVKIMKCRNPNKEKEGISKHFTREVCLLKKLSHQNIIKLHKFELNKSKTELCFDYCEYDLGRYINTFKKEQEKYNISIIKDFIRQILTGVDYLHSKRVFHRDLKPGNILIKDGIIKIADFGLSRYFSLKDAQYSKDVSTLYYRAPELILGLRNYSKSIDMWAIGCIFGELLCKKILFCGNSEMEHLETLFRVFGTFNDTMFPGFELLLNYKPKFQHFEAYGLRKYIKELSHFDLNEDALDLLEGMLTVNPCKRITCKEALRHVRIFY